MSAMLADAQIDVRIPRELGTVKRLRRHKGVVLGSNDERRHRDAIDDAERAGPMVIVFGAAETEVRRGVDLVEVAHGPNRRQPCEIEEAWTDAFLPADAPLEIPDEVPLVE